MRTDEWHSPRNIVDRMHSVLGYPALDPASCKEANARIKALDFITREQDGLTTPWRSGSIYLNPPGGKLRNKSLAALFWAKLMRQRESGQLSHAIYMAFSVEQLAVSQKYHPTMMATFPMIIPSERIAFWRPDGTPEEQPSHSNCIVYVPGGVDRRGVFFRCFGDLGACLNRGC